MDNLPNILRTGSLLPKNQLPKPALQRDLSEPRIQNRRTNTHVPCGPGGNLHDYVPFYFGPCSPMLFRIKCNNYPGYTGGQGSIVYLLTHIQAVMDAGHPFAFSDSHPIMSFVEFYDDLNHLDEVKWDIVEDKQWHPSYAHNSHRSKEFKQAEFLLHGIVPCTLLQGIAVFDEDRKAQVETMLATFHYQLRVKIVPKWYY